MSTTAGEIPGVGEVAGEAEATSEGEVASKVVGRTIAAVAGSLASSPCSGGAAKVSPIPAINGS